MLGLIRKMMKEKDKEIAELEYEPIVSTQDLTFTYATQGEWMDRVV